MKSWQKQILKLGLPIFFDWLDGLFSKKKKVNEVKIKILKQEAEKALVLGDYDKYLEIYKILKEMGVSL